MLIKSTISKFKTTISKSTTSRSKTTLNQSTTSRLKTTLSKSTISKLKTTHQIKNRLHKIKKRLKERATLRRMRLERQFVIRDS